MTAKITLYSEDELILEMKKFAKAKNTSVSKLVNGFFKTLLADAKSTTKKDAKITTSLLGVLKDTDIDDYKKYREEKYL